MGRKKRETESNWWATERKHWTEFTTPHRLATKRARREVLPIATRTETPGKALLPVS